MGRLSFRNTTEVFNYDDIISWCLARYDIEKKIGFLIKKNSSAIIAYRKDDLKQNIPLHDDYPIQKDDEIVLMRVPLSTPSDPWIPNSEMETQWRNETLPYEMSLLATRIKETHNEASRLALIKQQSLLAMSRPPFNKHHHPSRFIVVEKCKAWRTTPDTIEDIEPKQPSPQYVCYKCLNLLEPVHFIKDCPSHMTHKRQWLINKRPPHAVIKSTMKELKPPLQVDDLFRIEWIDALGRLWCRAD
jgi:hypothetical protein